MIRKNILHSKIASLHVFYFTGALNYLFDDVDSPVLWQRKIVNRPLAGTIRRGKTEKEDEVLENLLLSDDKQCAEHVMLVDLGRNDVGKVSLSLSFSPLSDR